MSEVVRLTLVSHAMTDAMAAGRFPADEPLNALGDRQLRAWTPQHPGNVICGPERRTQQTAGRLTPVPVVDRRLADLDVGAWRGARLDELTPGDIASWLSDPTAVPHGGESIVDLVGSSILNGQL